MQSLSQNKVILTAIIKFYLLNYFNRNVIMQCYINRLLHTNLLINYLEF